MMGFILKDFYLIRTTLKWLGIWLMLVLVVDSGSPPFTMMAVIMSVILIRNSMVTDDKNKTDQLFCSLPLKRSTIVFARYLGAFLAVVTVTAVMFLISTLHGKGVMDFESAYITVYMVLMFFFAFFPFYFRFGTQLRTDLGYVALAVTLFFFAIFLVGVTFFTTKDLDLSAIPDIHNIYIYSLMIFIASAVVSLFLSVRIFQKRDL